MTQTPQDPSHPPAPGWWLASDGRWYPPQPPAPGQPVPGPPPVAPSSSNRGCLIALAVVGAFLLICGVLVTVVIWKVADTVKDVAEGVTVGNVRCPTAEDVSEIIGSDVDLATSGNLVVAAGCAYTSAEANGGAGVSIVSGAGLIDDEVLADLETSAEGDGAETTSIDVGDDGLAYGSPSRSEAATKADDHIVQVEIFAESADPIGDKLDEAVELLEIFIDLNY
jgi:hypothetical protein